MIFDLNLVARIATLTNEDVENLPRIHIPDAETMFQLMAWRNKHKDLVRNFNSIVTEGVISVGTKDNLQYFNQRGAEIFHMHKTTVEEYVAFSYNKDTWTVTPITNKVTFYPADEVIQDMITVHATVMAYLDHAGMTEVKQGQVHIIGGVQL